MLILEGVKKSFNKNTVNENQVLKGISLNVEKGDFVTIIGSNGAGKSTLLNAIAGIFPIDEGKIIIDNKNITRFPDYQRASFIGRVFQDPMVGTAPTMSIEENLSLAFSRCHNLSLKWGLNYHKKKRFEQILSNIPLGLENRLNTKVAMLSGGQRQALTLVMATIKKPKLLLLDEHTAALDPKTAVLVNELTEEIIKKDNITTLMVTHNLEHAIEMGNRLIMMHQGKIVLDIQGEDKKAMTIPRLLAKFEQQQGEKFVEDRAMLA